MFENQIAHHMDDDEPLNWQTKNGKTLFAKHFCQSLSLFIFFYLVEMCHIIFVDI